MRKWIKSISVYLFYYFYTTFGLYLLPISIQGYSISIFDRTTLSIYFFIADILLMSIVGIIYNKEIVSGFKNITLKKIEFGISVWLIGMIVMGISNILISNYSPIPTAGNEEGVKSFLKILPIYMSFSTIIFSPFVEELMFRQTLRDVIKNDNLFMIASGLLFGFVHVIDSYTCYYDLLFIIPYGAMGVAFSYIYSKTKNLSIPMIIHSMHNTLLVIMFFFLGR